MTPDFHSSLTPILEAIQKLRRGRNDQDELTAAFNAAVKSAREAIEPHYQGWPSDFVDEIKGWFSTASEVYGQTVRGNGGRAAEHKLGALIGIFHTVAEGFDNAG